MRIAVISDVHGNLFALEAVLAAIEGDGVDVTVDRGRADVAFAVRTGRVA
ncbi:metallophosphoesterase [Actinoplanes missouriensis]|nr:metallophosphoesterase [Actinoplanes missouriensis]